MAENVMLREAMQAATQGQRNRARDLLTRLLRTDQSNPQYWLWMSAVVDSGPEKIFCLQNVLRLEPDNRAANLGLVIHGALHAPTSVTPSAPVRRKWAVTEAAGPPLTGFQKVMHNPVLRALALASIGLAVAGMIFLGFFGMQRGLLFAGRLTVTPIPWTPRPTATMLPTNTPWLVTPTATFEGPLPLGVMLKATYTPTPMYVITPHPISEAFRAGLRAFERGDFQEMLEYMQQAAQLESQAPDTHYYVGEAYRHLESFDLALEAYERAIAADPNFAPAYVGRARVLSALNPKADIQEDLETALELDPNLLDAYLEHTALLLQQGSVELALENLNSIERLAPESPFLYLYRAKANLLSDKDAAALEDALQAYNLDQTQLPVYLTLGQAYLKNHSPGKARNFLETYLRYETQDPLAWTAFGQALLELGHEYRAAVTALDQALELQEDLLPAYLYRGKAYLELGEGQAAVNDFFFVRKVDPESFEANFGLGRALLMVGRPEDAVSQISNSEAYAKSTFQKAEVYYWRAQMLESLQAYTSAANDWNALLSLPKEDIPQDWIATANSHLIAMSPSPTPTSTSTPKTPTPTRVPPTIMPSSTVTKTVIPTATTNAPKLTRTP